MKEQEFRQEGQEKLEAALSRFYCDLIEKTNDCGCFRCWDRPPTLSLSRSDLRAPAHTRSAPQVYRCGSVRCLKRSGALALLYDSLLIDSLSAWTFFRVVKCAPWCSRGGVWHPLSRCRTITCLLWSQLCFRREGWGLS